MSAQVTQAERAQKPSVEFSLGQFDLVMLNSITGGDPQLVRLLFTELRNANQLDLQQLDEGLSEERWRDLGQLAHRLKGAARMVGAQKLVDAVIAYEHGVSESFTDAQVRQLAFGVRAAVQALQVALDDWLEMAR